MECSADDRDSGRSSDAVTYVGFSIVVVGGTEATAYCRHYYGSVAF